MPGFWEGHEFPPDELERWADEIHVAASELPADDRAVFVSRACEGSAVLRARVDRSLDDAWDGPSVAASGGACRPGELVRDCLLLTLIGRGASGEVYKAIHRALRRLVAVKIVTGGASPAALAAEAANAARLLHPNIATIYDADLSGPTPCIVMEYVDAMTLRTWLNRWYREGGEAPPPAAFHSIVRQTALALAEAHRQGVIHRDIKPENVLVRKQGDDYLVKVVDFGIARRVHAPRGVTAGTPGYIAPERLGEPPSEDSRSDIFSLGVVLYELLSGQHPFRGASDTETHLNTLRVEPALPTDASRARLASVARRALQKRPDQRYRTADALVADLDQFQAPDTSANPLLSEFPGAVQRWFARHSSGFFVAWLSVIWGCTSLVLSAVSGSACVRVHWAGTVGTYQMIYGYAVEPNAALWYLAGASFCFLLGWAFLEAAHRGLARAPLVSVAGGDPMVDIANRNRRYFRYVTPLLAMTAIGFVGIPELAYRNDHAFGWVQVDMAGSYVGSTYADLRQSGKIGELAAVERLCAGCSAKVATVANRSGRLSHPPAVLFRVFLASALLHQTVLSAFLLWMGAKIVFFFGVLSTAMLGGAKNGVHLRLDFQDRDDYRFGLGQFDSAYYVILGLAAAGAIGLFLQAAGNVSKGTYLLGGDPAPALLGQAVLLLGTIALLTLLLAAPACVFLFLTIKAVNEELARLSTVRRSLEKQLAASRSVSEREQLRLDVESVRLQRETVGKQSLLPLRQPPFVALLAAVCLLLVVLPSGIRWLAGSPSTDPSRSTIRDAVCTVCGNAAP